MSASVRGAADKAAYLMGCKSPYRQLPDSDGEHIRGVGRSQPTSGSDVKVTAAIRYVRSGRSDLGGEQPYGPEQKRMTAAPKKRAVRKSLYGTEWSADPVQTRGRPLSCGKTRVEAPHEPPGERSKHGGKDTQRERREGPPPSRG